MAGLSRIKTISNRSKNIGLAIAFVATQIFVPISGTLSGTAAAAENKVTVCHASSATKNPYQEISVNFDAATGAMKDNGQGDHAAHIGPVWDVSMPNGGNWGDIIPPYTWDGGGSYPGLNWDAAGEAIWNNGCTPISTDTPVTAAPVTFVDECGTENDTFTVPTVTGVMYSELAGEHDGAGFVIVTASADQGYVLTPPYTFEYLFTNTTCPVDDISVTAKAPVSKDLTCKKDGFYKIPSVEGVQYKVDGDNVDGGKYFVNSAGTIQVTAEALPGFTLTGVASWELTFTDPENCEKPPKVTICHATHSLKNPYVQITVNQRAVDGIAGNSGNKADHFDEHDGPIFNVNMTKEDVWGDIIPPIDGVHDGLNWSDTGQAVYRNNCDTPKPVKVQTEAPTFVQATCESKGTYTIPEVEGVQYKMNGIVTPAGTYQATTGTSVTITAEALPGYVLKKSAATTWSFDFEVQGGCVLGDNDVCPNIIGTQTTIPSGYAKNQTGDCVKPAGHVLGDSTELPNTGASALFNMIIGLSLITVAVGARYAGRYQLEQK